MNQVIFYGAGWNAKKNLPRWVQSGLIPQCFADRDTSKHGLCVSNSDTGEIYEIVSLEEARDRFPDVPIYVATIRDSYPDIRQQLIKQGVPSELIKYPDNTGARYCNEYQIQVSGTTSAELCYSYCCGRYKAPAFKGKNDIAEDIAKLNDLWTDLAGQMEQGAPTRCDACPSLTTKKQKKSKIAFCITSGIQGGTKCNFKCCYCSPHDNRLINSVAKGSITVFDVMKYICHNYDADEILLNYAAGEICLSEYCDEMLNLWLDNGVLGSIATNASIYNEKIAEGIRRGIIMLIISLDAGSPQTFAKIKNVDLFERTVDNVRRYASCHNKRVMLKYIMLEGINDNLSDITGFIKLAQEIKSDVILSFDYRLIYGGKSADYTVEFMKTVLDFFRIASDFGVMVYYATEVLDKAHMTWLDALAEQNNSKRWNYEAMISYYNY